MICPVCKDTDHRLYDRGGSTTLMYCAPFYENGVYHSHDRNIHSWAYECSNGHLITTRSYGTCPAGDFDSNYSESVAYKCADCGAYGKDAPEGDCKSMKCRDQ